MRCTRWRRRTPSRRNSNWRGEGSSSSTGRGSQMGGSCHRSEGRCSPASRCRPRAANRSVTSCMSSDVAAAFAALVDSAFTGAVNVASGEPGASARGRRAPRRAGRPAGAAALRGDSGSRGGPAAARGRRVPASGRGGVQRPGRRWRRARRTRWNGCAARDQGGVRATRRRPASPRLARHARRRAGGDPRRRDPSGRLRSAASS